jgi:hypothetical protein
VCFSMNVTLQYMISREAKCLVHAQSRRRRPRYSYRSCRLRGRIQNILKYKLHLSLLLNYSSTYIVSAERASSSLRTQSAKNPPDHWQSAPAAVHSALTTAVAQSATRFAAADKYAHLKLCERAYS